MEDLQDEQWTVATGLSTRSRHTWPTAEQTLWIAVGVSQSATWALICRTAAEILRAILGLLLG
ncbi:MAG TPA: hypothetical protein VKE40_15510 [Gemmataceae bacterium]|nr:hypothetical protein [Gemmataceae bacterium]